MSVSGNASSIILIPLFDDVLEVKKEGLAQENYRKNKEKEQAERQEAARKNQKEIFCFSEHHAMFWARCF